MGRLALQGPVSIFEKEKSVVREVMDGRNSDPRGPAANRNQQDGERNVRLTAGFCELPGRTASEGLRLRAAR